MNSASHYYNPNRYLATFIRAVDGDTVHLMVDLGLRVCREIYLRLADIDTDELRSKNPTNRARAYEAKRQLEGLLEIVGIGDRGHRLLVQFRKGKSFDRWVGTLTIRNEITGFEVNVNEWMVGEGHAVRTDKKGKRLRP